MNEKKCEACGRLVRFVEGPDGKSIPMDLVATVYRVEVAENGVDLVARRAPRSVPGGLAPEPAYWVSHFSTCSDPNRFSRGKTT